MLFRSVAKCSAYERKSFAPQNREVSTDDPMLIPMHKNVNSEMYWFASEEADRAVSPNCPSIIVSTRFTPVVITLCNATGKATFTRSL